MKYFLIGLCLMFIYSCKRKIPSNHEITKIEFARSGAWQDWGAAISIDSTLTYKYFGAMNNDSSYKKKYYIGKVSPQFWDTLKRKLESIKFRQIPLTDNFVIEDANNFELIVHWRNQKRRITRVWVDSADTTLLVLKWINITYKNLKLKQVEAPVKFETTFQNGPPIPDIKEVKFPPPTAN